MEVLKKGLLDNQAASSQWWLTESLRHEIRERNWTLWSGDQSAGLNPIGLRQWHHGLCTGCTDSLVCKHSRRVQEKGLNRQSCFCSFSSYLCTSAHKPQWTFFKVDCIVSFHLFFLSYIRPASSFICTYGNLVQKSVRQLVTELHSVGGWISTLRIRCLPGSRRSLWQRYFGAVMWKTHRHFCK